LAIGVQLGQSLSGDRVRCIRNIPHYANSPTTRAGRVNARPLPLLAFLPESPLSCRLTLPLSMDSHGLVFPVEVWEMVFRRPEMSKHTLFTLALVCRTLSEIARSILWKDLGGLDLLFMLLTRATSTGPTVVSPRYPRLSVSNLDRRWIQADWARFYQHAERVRSLKMTFILNDPLMSALRAIRPFLPNVTHVDWFVSSSSHSMVDIILACPTIQNYSTDEGQINAICTALRLLPTL
jgi:hypothetical protein